jgi:tetratricopeptide (TPR) repeat protein
VVVPCVEAEQLTIQRVGEPGQRVPVRLGGGGERPAHGLPTETIWSHNLDVIGDTHSERQLGNALIKAGRVDEAMPHLFHVAELDPRDSAAHVNIATYYASRGQIDNAIPEFQAVVRMTDSPNLTTEDQHSRFSALLGLGFAYTQAGKYPEALDSFHKANQVDSTVVESTIANLERAAAASRSERLCLELSLLLRAKGRDREAASVLEEGIKANPDYEHARELLRILSEGR